MEQKITSLPKVMGHTQIVAESSQIRYFCKWSFAALFLLGAFYYDIQKLTVARELITRAIDELASVFGDNNGFTALWRMRASPMFIHGSTKGGIIKDLLLAETQLISPKARSFKRTNHMVEVRNHLTYAYQMEGDFETATKVSETANQAATSADVSLTSRCCATGLLAENCLVGKRFEDAKTYADEAVHQHENIFGADPQDGGLSAWRRRNTTIMAIACSYLGEVEIAEVMLTWVEVEAVKYEGADGDLSVHARHNLDCIRKLKSRHQQMQSQQCAGTDSSDPGRIEGDAACAEILQQMTTDRHVIYVRWDLAMGLFDTLGHVDRTVRGAEIL